VRFLWSDNEQINSGNWQGAISLPEPANRLLDEPMSEPNGLFKSANDSERPMPINDSIDVSKRMICEREIDEKITTALSHQLVQQKSKNANCEKKLKNSNKSFCAENVTYATVLSSLFDSLSTHTYTHTIYNCKVCFFGLYKLVPR
jgi:hypothetical protein